MPSGVNNGQIQFSFDKRQLTAVKDMLKRLSPNKRDGAAERGLKKITLYGEAELKNRILRGEVLKVRSGRLRQSIGSVLIKEGRGWKAVIGSGVRTGKRVVYANIHETGGIIRPKASNKSGFLWIPIRKGSGFAIVQGLSPSSGRTSFSSKAVGFRRVRSVTIPARHYLSKTAARIDRQAVAIMVKEIDAEIKKA